MPTARSWTDVYRARTAYLDPAAIARYEDSRFRGPLGAYKLRRERRVVRSALAALPPNLRAVDCPTGVGRWISTLADRGHQVIGVDISVAMLTEARRRAEGVAAVHAEAEHLPFGDDCVDLVFSFALAKHLPREVLFGVLDEFVRVARIGVVCTVNTTPPVLWAWAKRRAPRSRAVDLAVLRSWAQSRGLSLRDFGRCHSPIGMERCLLLRGTD
ncbi:MAG: class I SAM-dependent methyltransferase [Geodermatophilaceae bacterium]|nr:class I SAM-dependent methyltransferase [Geodermatophilaceae bacterium]